MQPLKIQHTGKKPSGRKPQNKFNLINKNYKRIKSKVCLYTCLPLDDNVLERMHRALDFILHQNASLALYIEYLMTLD